MPAQVAFDSWAAGPTDKHTGEVNRLFQGEHPSKRQVAKRLGISKTTVNEIVKRHRHHALAVNRIDGEVSVGEDRPGTILVLEYVPGDFWRGLVAASATIEGRTPLSHPFLIA